MRMSATLTTGLPGLDKVLEGVMPGDNIVWQVDTRGRLPGAGHALRRGGAAGRTAG